MNSENRSTRSLIAWAQLVRLPNVFTVLADVGAAFLLVSHGPYPIARLVLILLSGVALYWAGMILNDVFDVDKDRQEREQRPIPAGDIPLSQAQMAGWGLIVVGVILAFAAGYVPDEVHATTYLPGAVAIALAVMIVAYDGPLKKTPLAPAAMGSCRVLSFALGAAPCGALAAFPFLPGHVIALAVGFGVYIMGITTMARREATGGSSPNLVTGLIITAIGAALISMAPKFAGPLVEWKFNANSHYPVLIALIAFPVVLRGLRAIKNPSPKTIQVAIKTGILTIIPLASAVALLGAGALWAVVVISLVAPSFLLASRLRVT